MSSRSSSSNQLVKVDGLGFGLHTLGTTINCPSGSAFEFRYAEVDGFMGKAGQVANNQTIDDAETDVMNYVGNWVHNSSSTLIGHYQDTQSYTQTAGDSFSYSFKGASISVYGSLYPNHGPFTISLGGTSKAYTGWNPLQVPPTLLFFQGGMDPNQVQVITGKNVGPGTFEIDSILVQSPSGTVITPSSSPGSTPSQSGSPTPTPTPVKSNTLIIIVSVAGAASLIILVLLFALFRKRIRRMFSKTPPKPKVILEGDPLLDIPPVDPPQYSPYFPEYYQDHLQQQQESRMSYPPKAAHLSSSSQASQYSYLPVDQSGQLRPQTHQSYDPSTANYYQPPAFLGQSSTSQAPTAAPIRASQKPEKDRLPHEWYDQTGPYLEQGRQANIRDMVLGTENKQFTVNKGLQ
jgi:hypothetical protein